MKEAKSSSGFVRKVLRWLLPLGFSAAAIWLVLRDVEWTDVVQNLSKIPASTILLASLIFLLGLSLRVFCWYLLLGRRISYKDTFFVMNAGYLLNNIFPFRLGEIGRAMLLDDPEGLSAWEVLSSIILERVLDVFLAGVFVLGMLPRIIGGAYDQRLISLALGIAVIGIIVLYLTARYRSQIALWLEKWSLKSTFVQKWLSPKLVQILNGLAVFDRPSFFLLAFGSLAASWGLAFLMHYLVFSNLFPTPPFWWMIFVLGAGAFGAALPSAPAALGVFEGVMVAAFSLLGVDQGLAFTHAIIVHAIQFMLTNILGLVGLRLRGQAVVDLYRRATRQSSDVPSSR